MLRFKVWNKCYLCGTETAEIGYICKKCKKTVHHINGSVCEMCGMPLISEQNKCLRCRETSFNFNRNISLFEYKGTARDIFYQYKFRNHKAIALWYGELVDRIIENRFGEYLVVPSPGSRKKKIRKGWDQVEYLCLILKRKYGRNVMPVLAKKGGIDQKKLDFESRQMNLNNRISLRKGFLLEGRKILLIDDIFTTGATADECARILLSDNAGEVVSLTLAID